MCAVKAGGLFAATGLAFCGLAQGAGFAISDKSVSSLGVAFAGEAALAENASTVYNNPAGMLQLQGSQFSAGLHRMTTVVEFKDGGSSTSGADATQTDVEVFIPNLYYVTELSPEWRAGFGLYSPFGLGLDYGEEWRGRYHSIKNDLVTLNLSPAVSYRANPRLGLGASLDIQYAEASLKQAVDFAAICLMYSLPPTTCDAIVEDGYQSLQGKAWSYGLSFGLTYEISEATRLGAVYHGPVSQDLEGKSDFDNVPAVFATIFTDSDGRLKVHMPETISLSIAHAVNERLRLLADYTWTGWGRYKELRVEFENGLNDAVSEEHWNDTSRYAVGAQYRWSPALLLRAGFAYDETPVPDAGHRSPRVPDADRRWFTVGAGWSPAADFSVDFAYAYIAASDIPIDNTDDFGHELKGRFDASGDFLSAQANWRF